MGLSFALLIMCLWSGHLLYILNYATVDFMSVKFYFHIFIQAYLYTGLFITGHDAMHKTVSRNQKINHVIGTISSFLYAGLSYKRLTENHFKHHKYPGTEKDPDFFIKSQNFFVWWGSFMIRYATFLQILKMALVFNVLKLWVAENNLLFYWVLPALISSLQLFYFGTFLPHKYPHTHEMEPHNARSQKKNHIIAMLSCYFFGYHLEHHQSPQTPWWKLYQLK